MQIKYKNPFKNIKTCPGCILKDHSRKQVIGKGSIPAKILFLGDGPNKTEDLLGESLIGPPGDLLEQMIQDSCIMINRQIPSYYITNIVLCRPWIWDTSDPDYSHNREPSKQEVLACMANIIEITKVIKPKLVVFLSRIVEAYYHKEFSVYTRITHPSIHLRYGGKSSPTYMQDIRTLSEALRKVK